ncbi:MAG: hypothetical protein GF315_13785 [candidate division Zixibacteria bacterium]|nr:hypothetical protein [candidate division Zixibacteria bacterium]
MHALICERGVDYIMDGGSNNDSMGFIEQKHRVKQSPAFALTASTHSTV